MAEFTLHTVELEQTNVEENTIAVVVEAWSAGCTKRGRRNLASSCSGHLPFSLPITLYDVGPAS